MSFLVPASVRSLSSSSLRNLRLPALGLPSSSALPQTRGIKFAPKRTRHGQSAFKGRVPIHVGGATKGTTLAFGGEYGMRSTNGVRIKAKQLEAAFESIRRKMKPFKGVEIIMRVFPDRPVTAKGAQARMGKGKGAFDYWACHVPMNHTIFELRGGNLRPEIAKDTLRIAGNKLPCGTQFITSATLPRVGTHTVQPSTPSALTDVVIEDFTPLTPEEVKAEELAAAAEAGPAVVQRFSRQVRVSEKIAQLPPGVRLGFASGQKVMVPL